MAHCLYTERNFNFTDLVLATKQAALNILLALGMTFASLFTMTIALQYSDFQLSRFWTRLVKIGLQTPTTIREWNYHVYMLMHMQKRVSEHSFILVPL